jgi:hypothetical protein
MSVTGGPSDRPAKQKCCTGQYWRYLFIRGLYYITNTRVTLVSVLREYLRMLLVCSPDCLSLRSIIIIKVTDTLVCNNFALQYFPCLPISTMLIAATKVPSWCQWVLQLTALDTRKLIINPFITILVLWTGKRQFLHWLKITRYLELLCQLSNDVRLSRFDSRSTRHW